MAGAKLKYRHLSRSSAHRQALLRNLVTSLFKHESISTTWHKAKEAQRMAEKLVTLAKKNTEATRRRAHQIFFVRRSQSYPLISYSLPLVAPRNGSQVIWTHKNALPQKAWWLHANIANRTHKRRSGRIRHTRACRWTQRSPFCRDGEDSFKATPKPKDERAHSKECTKSDSISNGWYELITRYGK